MNTFACPSRADFIYPPASIYPPVCLSIGMSSSLASLCSQACLGLSSADCRLSVDTMPLSFLNEPGGPEMEVVSTGIVFFAPLNSIPRDSLHVEHRIRVGLLPLSKLTLAGPGRVLAFAIPSLFSSLSSFPSPCVLPHIPWFNPHSGFIYLGPPGMRSAEPLLGAR